MKRTLSVSIAIERGPVKTSGVTVSPDCPTGSRMALVAKFSRSTLAIVGSSTSTFERPSVSHAT